MLTKPDITVPLGGIDQRWGADKRQAWRVRDMTWDRVRGAWTSAGGSRRVILGVSQDGGVTFLSPFVGIGAVQSMHHFSQHNGARNWLIYEDGNGNLYQFNPSTAARSSSPGDVARDRSNSQQNDRAVPTAPWQRSQSCTWGDHLYLVNGINRPLVFDGYTWDYAGFSAPAGTPSASLMTAPHATTQGGSKLRNIGLGPTSGTAGTDYICAYRYRMSYINSRGEEGPLSAPSDIVTFTNTGGGGVSNGAHFALVNTPRGGSEVVRRRLYRTQNINDSTGNAVIGRSETFYYHSDIPDNATSVFMDGLPDSALGNTVDPTTRGAWPAGAIFVASFKNTLFLVTNDSTKVYFSAPNHPEMFPVDNVLELGDAHLGPITGIYPSRNALVIFKAHAIFLVKGDPVNGFYAITLTREVGCAAPNTVKEVPGVGLVFLSEGGIHALQGTLENEGVQTGTIPLHVPVSGWVDRLNKSALIGACAAVYHQDREYWLCVPQIGVDTNNLVLVFHYEIKEWSYRENFPISCILETADHRGHLLYGSWDTSSSSTVGIFVYSRGWPDKNGTAIQPLYQSGWNDAGGAIWRTQRPKNVLIRAGMHGDNDMVLVITSNRTNATWPAIPSKDQQVAEDRQPVWGIAAYDGTTQWQSLRPGVLNWEVSAPREAEVHEVSLTVTPASGQRWITVQALDLESAPDDPNTYKPIPAGRRASP